MVAVSQMCFSWQFSRKLNAGDKTELHMKTELNSDKVFLSGFTGWVLDQHRLVI